MKKSLLGALVLGATLTVCACNDKENKPSPAVENAKTSAAEAKEAVVDAAKDAKDAAAEK